MDRSGESDVPRTPNPTARADVSPSMSALAPESTATGDAPTPGDASSPGDHGHDFDSLFAAHYERLVRALTLVAGDPESAADAVQEAFVKAHLRWRRISRYDDPIGWVRRVAINQIRDGHRRRKRHDRAVARLATRQQTTMQPVEPDEFGRLLAAPQAATSGDGLFYVDGLSVAEIAPALDIAEGSVKSHLHDARRRLHPLLESER